ncbi:hypothetical protein LSAT2_028875 [Lamellibrachia satsuma]|nr:hypothetical protein LSAT2_028875 [Lamellibrachia satsuma]
MFMCPGRSGRSAQSKRDVTVPLPEDHGNLDVDPVGAALVPASRPSLCPADKAVATGADRWAVLSRAPRPAATSAICRQSATRRATNRPASRRRYRAR